MNDLAPPATLAAARRSRQTVEAAIERAKLDAARARVVRRVAVVEHARALRAQVLAALDRLAREVLEVWTPDDDEWRAHAVLAEAAARALEGIAATAGAESYQQALGRAARPRRRLAVSEWADRHRWLRTGTAQPGEWRTSLVPYTREIMDALSAHDPCNEVVIMKAAQVAGTEVALNWLGYLISHAPAEAMLVMPTLELRDRFVKRRLRPLIRETDVVRDALGGQRSRDADAGIGLLSFPGGSLILAGANSPNSLRSDAVRYVILDEVDGFDWEVGKEGDPLALIENRQRTYSRRKTLLVSTPTVRGASRIEQRYQASDRRRYHVPCPDCGVMQPLRWANLRWHAAARPSTLGEPEQATVTAAWYECADCGARIDEHLKPDLLARGQWIAEAPGAPTRGYHLSALYAPLGLGLRWAEIAQKWLDAQGDRGRLQVFVNTYLGETWEDKRRHATEARDIAERAEPYALRTAPADCLLVTVGVDVQDDRLSVQWLGHGAGRRWWALDWVEPPGNPTHDAVWDGLLDLLLQAIPHAAGGQLRVRAVGVDIGGHHTAQVKAWVTRAGAALGVPVMAMQGSRHRATAVLPRRPMHSELTASGKRARRGTPVWQIGTEVAKDVLYNDLAADAELPPDERRGHFAADLPPEYYAQLTAESFNPIRNRYELRRGRRNEALDTWVYALAAAHHPLLRVDKMTERHWQDLRQMIVPPPPPVPGQPPRPAAPAATRPATPPPARGFGSEDWQL